MCELDINECEDFQACQANHTCINLDGGFKCVCRSGFEKTGKDSCLGKPTS